MACTIGVIGSMGAGSWNPDNAPATWLATLDPLARRLTLDLTGVSNPSFPSAYYVSITLDNGSGGSFVQLPSWTFYPLTTVHFDSGILSAGHPYRRAGFTISSGAAGRTISISSATLTVTDCYPPPGALCYYGTRRKATSPLEELLTEAGLVAILEAAGLAWWEVLLLVFAGQQVDIAALCSSLPPTPPVPSVDALGYPPYKLLTYLYAAIWNHYCECVPGSVSTNPPPDPTGTKPTGFPDPRTIVINPTNPCLDITEVRRMLDSVLRNQSVTGQLVQLLQRYGLPFATVRGATHSGLTGSGSFAVSRLIGVQIVITGRPPGRELEGAPQYVWDLGWASLMDGNGFIVERRITRDVEVWLPPHFQEATTFGYVFKDGVTANVTELQAET